MGPYRFCSNGNPTTLSILLWSYLILPDNPYGTTPPIGTLFLSPATVGFPLPKHPHGCLNAAEQAKPFRAKKRPKKGRSPALDAQEASPKIARKHHPMAPSGFHVFPIVLLAMRHWNFSRNGNVFFSFKERFDEY